MGSPALNTIPCQSAWIYSGTLLAFTIAMIIWLWRSDLVLNDPIKTILNPVAALSLSLGGFGVLFTLYQYFDFIEVNASARPGQYALVMPLLFSTVVFTGCGALSLMLWSSVKKG